MPWKTLDDMTLAGQVVLVRVDINVPMEDGVVTDSTRIDRILPSINDILSQGGKPVLLAHFGRPKGEVRPDMSLNLVRPELEAKLGAPVRFAEDCIGLPAKQAVSVLLAGEVLLLENTRFHVEESNNDPKFAASLAALGDIFCNDAFSAAHRAHASTEGIARLLPSCAGRLMQAELSALEGALGNPERPVAAVVGGAKVSTKLELLSNLVARVDHLVIGGGMANTFMAAKGISVGKSLCEHDLTGTASDILAKAKSTGCTIHLPWDIVVAKEFAENAAHRVVSADQCPDVEMILDAGPETVAALSELFESCKTLIWNGPLGAFEISPFDAATVATAQKVAALSKAGDLVSVAGGGDTVAALNHAGVAGDFTYISTAGGAFLEWMEGKTLPGVAALG